MSNAAKNFDILAISSDVLHNYFDAPNLFSDLYLVKFLDTSAKALFPCTFTAEFIYSFLHLARLKNSLKYEEKYVNLNRTVKYRNDPSYEDHSIIKDTNS